MLDQLKREAKKRAAPELLSREDRKGLRKVYRE
jgi:PiT family inorganic phosphate transporter